MRPIALPLISRLAGHGGDLLGTFKIETGLLGLGKKQTVAHLEMR